MAAVASALLAVGVLVLVGLGARPAQRAAGAPVPVPSCPARAHADGPRAARTAALLSSTTVGRPLAAALTTICFGPLEWSGVRPDGSVVLDERAADGENAARLGHLLRHVGDPRIGALRTDRRRPCAELVGDALAAEADGYAVELELRQELDVSAPLAPLPFAESYWTAAPADRAEVVRAFLHDHPRGGAGVLGYVELYQAQCEAARARAGSAGP